MCCVSYLEVILILAMDSIVTSSRRHHLRFHRCSGVIYWPNMAKYRAVTYFRAFAACFPKRKSILFGACRAILCRNDDIERYVGVLALDTGIVSLLESSTSNTICTSSIPSIAFE